MDGELPENQEVLNETQERVYLKEYLLFVDYRLKMISDSNYALRFENKNFIKVKSGSRANFNMEGDVQE
jgi:hypothetical protein